MLKKLLKAHLSHSHGTISACPTLLVCACDCPCDCVQVLRLAPCLYEDQPVLNIVEWATWQKNMHAKAIAAGRWTEQQFQQEDLWSKRPFSLNNPEPHI